MKKRLLVTIRLCVLALAAGLCPGTVSVLGGTQSLEGDREVLVREWIDREVPILMEKGKVPGVSVAVVQDGKIIYASGFGARDSERGLPTTADTLFGIGSITKSFVAVGILKLAEEGKLSLDDPVSKHVPFALGSEGNPITIHHLLTHSSGVSSLATSSVALYRGLGLDLGVPLSSAEDFYRFVNGATDEVVAEPGRRFFYHNGGWRVLGDVLQTLSGKPFHQYLIEDVIKPLGMERTTLIRGDFEGDSDRIVPHSRDAEGAAVPAEFPYPDPDDNPEFSFLSAAGGIMSSANEMTRYLEMLIDQGRFSGGRLLSAESSQVMQTIHIDEEPGYYGRAGYGYGLAIIPDFFGHKVITHAGSVIVSTANMACIPELRVGVICMANSSGMPLSTVSRSVLAILAGVDPEALPDRKLKKRTEKLKGKYETYRGIEMVKVIEKGGMLYLEAKDRLSESVTLTPLIPEDPMLGSTDFYTLRGGLKRRVEFRVAEEKGTELILGRYRYRRVE